MGKELTLDEARQLVSKNEMVYVVVQNEKIIKIFNHSSTAWEFCQKMGTPSLDVGYRTEALDHYVHYNITHPKCPRFAKFELGYLTQLDLFLDIPKVLY